MARSVVEANDGVDQFGNLGELRVPDELEISTPGRENDATAISMVANSSAGCSFRTSLGFALELTEISRFTAGNSVSIAESRSRAIPAMTAGSWMDEAM